MENASLTPSAGKIISCHEICPTLTTSTSTCSLLWNTSTIRLWNINSCRRLLWWWMVQDSLKTWDILLKMYSFYFIINNSGCPLFTQPMSQNGKADWCTESEIKSIKPLILIFHVFVCTCYDSEPFNVIFFFFVVPTWLSLIE